MKFIKEVLACFYPPKYKKLKNTGFWKSYSFLLKVLFLTFLISSVLLIPKFSSLRSDIVDDLSKINILNISGKIDISEPILIPSKDPLMTIDIQNKRSMKKEILLINKEEFQFRFFGKRKIDLDKLKNPAENKQEVGTFAACLILLLAPGFALIIFFKIAVKYLLIIFLLGSILFFLMDLTNRRLKYKKALSITAHAGIPIMIIETISAVINPTWMLPFMRFIGLNIYAIPLLAWIVYSTICIFTATKQKEHKDGKD